MKWIKVSLLFLFISNCSNEELNNDSIGLNGRWHLFDVSGNEKIYYKLDIENDTIGYF